MSNPANVQSVQTYLEENSVAHLLAHMLERLDALEAEDVTFEEDEPDEEGATTASLSARGQ